MTTKQSNRPPSLNCESKGNTSFRVLQQIRRIFLSGRKVTAVEINQETHSNDARKVISNLRNKENWKIEDIRLPGGRKLYWLVPGGNKEESKSGEGAEK